MAALEVFLYSCLVLGFALLVYYLYPNLFSYSVSGRSLLNTSTNTQNLKSIESIRRDVNSLFDSVLKLSMVEREQSMIANFSKSDVDFIKEDHSKMTYGELMRKRNLLMILLNIPQV